MGELSSTIHQVCQLSINWTNGYGDLNLHVPLRLSKDLDLNFLKGREVVQVAIGI
jgi:hypothetical protein